MVENIVFVFQLINSEVPEAVTFSDGNWVTNAADGMFQASGFIATC